MHNKLLSPKKYIQVCIGGRQRLLFEAMTVSHTFFIFAFFLPRYFCDNACVSIFFLFHFCAYLACILWESRGRKTNTNSQGKNTFQNKIEKKTSEVVAKVVLHVMRNKKLTADTSRWYWLRHRIFRCIYEYYSSCMCVCVFDKCVTESEISSVQCSLCAFCTLRRVCCMRIRKHCVGLSNLSSEKTVYFFLSFTPCPKWNHTVHFFQWKWLWWVYENKNYRS